MIDPKEYKREGYRLTDEGESLLSQWEDFGGCSCHTGHAPCSSCTHEGNPISLAEGDEYWEPEEGVQFVTGFQVMRSGFYPMKIACIVKNKAMQEYAKRYVTDYLEEEYTYCQKDDVIKGTFKSNYIRVDIYFFIEKEVGYTRKIAGIHFHGIYEGRGIHLSGDKWDFLKSRCRQLDYKDVIVPWLDYQISDKEEIDVSRAEIKKKGGKTKLTLNHAVPAEEITSREIYDKVLKAFVEAGGNHIDGFGEYDSFQRMAQGTYLTTASDKDIVWRKSNLLENRTIISVKDIDFGEEEEEDAPNGASRWFGFKYQVTPETSKLLQEEVFKAGGKWKGSGSTRVKNTNERVIYVDEDGLVSWGNLTCFSDDHLPEKKIFINPLTGELQESYDGEPTVVTHKERGTGGSGKGWLFEGACQEIPEPPVTTYDKIKKQMEDFYKTVPAGIMGIDLSDHPHDFTGYCFLAPIKNDDHVEPNSNFKDFLTKRGEVNMASMSNVTSTNRREVKVSLFDNDPGLDVEDSLVGKWKVLTEDDADTTIRELLMNANVKGAMEKHNEKRIKTVDKEVLHRTGQQVFLQPIKLKNLKWTVSEA